MKTNYYFDHIFNRAVKNVWKYVRHLEDFRIYLPAEEMDDGQYPDRAFFWGIAFTVLPTWANNYYDMVIEKKRKEVVENPANRKVISITPAFREKLAQFPFKTLSKGKVHTIMFEAGRVKKSRRVKRKGKLIELFCDGEVGMENDG